MGFTTLYAPSIRDAIKRNDKHEMQQLLDHAKQVEKEQGDLPAAVRELEQALAKHKP